MKTAVQYVATESSESDARRVLAAFAEQEGYIGGRILAPSRAKGGWRVQVFHEAGGIHPGQVVDAQHDCRGVFLPDSLMAQLS